MDVDDPLFLRGFDQVLVGSQGSLVVDVHGDDLLGGEVPHRVHRVSAEDQDAVHVGAGDLLAMDGDAHVGDFGSGHLGDEVDGVVAGHPFHCVGVEHQRVALHGQHGLDGGGHCAAQLLAFVGQFYGHGLVALRERDVVVEREVSVFDHEQPHRAGVEVPELEVAVVRHDAEGVFVRYQNGLVAAHGHTLLLPEHLDELMDISDDAAFLLRRRRQA